MFIILPKNQFQKDNYENDHHLKKKDIPNQNLSSTPFIK